MDIENLTGAPPNDDERRTGILRVIRPPIRKKRWRNGTALINDNRYYPWVLFEVRG